MLSPHMLSGTGVALVTPFLKSGSIDFNGLANLVNHVIKGKVDYLVVTGTTGESVTLSKDEKHAVLNCVISVNAHRVPVVAGIGSNSTAEVIYALDSKELEGVDAILSVTPYYNRPNQQGLYEHYKAIAKFSPVPVILYNVPVRTGINMTAETQLRIANDFSNIIATKEASGDALQIMNIIEKKPKDFLVISGDDFLTLPLIACGAQGVISVSANAYPKMISDMVRAALKNKFSEAREIHYKLAQITKLMFTEGNPAGIKEVLQYIGICKNHLRMPLVNVSKELSKKISKALL